MTGTLDQTEDDRAIDSAKKTGRREANKRDKLNRIRNAAREVFVRNGFEKATLQEIAETAGVAFGTLYLYAKDKQDLLLLLFENELPLLTQRGAARAETETAFLRQLNVFFDEFYTFFGTNPQLSRDMMREITFSGGIVSERIIRGHSNTIAAITGVVSKAQERGELRSDFDVRKCARMIFSLYRMEIRAWLNHPGLSQADGLKRLQDQFELLFNGLKQ